LSRSSFQTIAKNRFSYINFCDVALDCKPYDPLNAVNTEFAADKKREPRQTQN
jgi:hypothetical protein